MKSSAIVLALVLGATPALAANAEAPNANVDKRNDAGNSTGNDKVDALNRGQLDGNQKPGASSGAATGGTVPAGPAPAAAAPAAPK